MIDWLIFKYWTDITCLEWTPVGHGTQLFKHIPVFTLLTTRLELCISYGGNVDVSVGVLVRVSITVQRRHDRSQSYEKTFNWDWLTDSKI